MSNEKKVMAKNFIWNTIGTGFNSFNSLFFLIIVTRINGIENAGIFSIAYATATILYTLALYSGRLCQVTDIENRIKDKDYIANRLFTCFIMLICASIYLISKQYTSFKTGVFISLILFRGIEAFADILYGVMQKNGVLYKAGISLTAKGVIGLILFGVIDFFKGAFVVRIGKEKIPKFLGDIRKWQIKVLGNRFENPELLNDNSQKITSKFKNKRGANK